MSSREVSFLILLSYCLCAYLVKIVLAIAIDIFSQPTTNWLFS